MCWPTCSNVRPPEPGVRMCGRDHVGTGPVHFGMDGEGGGVQHAVALEQRAADVDEEQVRRTQVRPAPTEWVHPEPVRELGVAHGDVACNPMVVAHVSEEPIRDCEVALAMCTLFVNGREAWRFERHR